MIGSVRHPKQDVFKSGLVKDAFFSQVYEFPLIKRTSYKPIKAIPFDKITKSSNTDQWVHFYIHDVCFERIWNNPKKYINLLKRYKGVISPDFSLYRELPLAMQIWNTYRNRALAYWFQINGLAIIPNIRWGDERTYKFAFEGIEQGGTVAVSTNGTLRNKTDRYYFSQGLLRMVESLKPDTIIVYSYTPDDVFQKVREQSIEVIQIENYTRTVRRAAV